MKAGRRYKFEYTILANRAGVIVSDVINGFTLPSTVGADRLLYVLPLLALQKSMQRFTIKRSGVTDIDITNISPIEVDEFLQMQRT